MAKRRDYILLVLTVVCLCVGNMSVLFAAQSREVSLSWTFEDERLTLKEPVVLKLSVENRTSDVVLLNLGADFKEGVLFTVVSPSGVVTRNSKVASEAQRLGKARIEPGKTYSHDFVVNDWYDFTASGTYEIRVRLKYPVIVGQQTISIGDTSQLITIDEPDEEALRRRCEQLTTLVLNSNSAEEAGSAAQALSFVRDPVVVKFLVRSMESPIAWVQDIALRALGQFATPEAIDALIPITRRGGPDSQWARATLLETAQKVQDTNLRRYIYQALREPEPR